MNAPLQKPPLPLENGDHLSRDEFERRYHAMPEVKKAELIDGVVYMPSPVRFHQHARPHGELVVLLGTYAFHTPGVAMGDNASLRLDDENEVQPDALLFIEPGAGGATVYDADGYLSGSPELAAEVASSSASIDRGRKLRAYQRNGVKEYLVWRVLDQAFDGFALGEQGYTPMPTDEGVLRSGQFPGLWLDVLALLRGDLPRVHEVLHEGLRSAEHRAFVERLSRRAPAE